MGKQFKKSYQHRREEPRGLKRSNARGTGKPQPEIDKASLAITKRLEAKQLQNNALALSFLSNPNPTWIGPYSNRQRILLVGEGDFSFTRALVTGLGKIQQLVATCFDSVREVEAKYGEETVFFLNSLHKNLATTGVSVYYDVDATKMHERTTKDALVRSGPFDIVVFNFPHVGGGSLEDDKEKNICLVRDFFASINESSWIHNPRNRSQFRVHMILRDTSFYKSWNIIELAKEQGFILDKTQVFESGEFEKLGYKAVRTSGTKTMRGAPETLDATRYIFAFSKS